jgi:hypothetical protein
MDYLEKIAAHIAQAKKTDSELPTTEAIDRIERLNDGLANFWGNGGWASGDTAELISKSRLDWQASLSRSLRHWAIEPADSIEDGDLILAWTNLGSLIEGTIKLFLSVNFASYKNDLENLKKTQAWHKKKEMLLEPDGLTLGVLLHYCKIAKLFPADEIELCERVQKYRNAIHAFEDKPIGTGSELHLAIKAYLGMLRSTNLRLPYPDDQYQPREF